MCLGNRAESAYLSHCRLSMCDGGSCRGHRGINCWWVAPVHRSGGSQNPDRWLKELRNNQEEELSAYKTSVVDYVQAKKSCVHINIGVHNDGTSKASNASVTIKFPDGVMVYDEEIMDMEEPKSPKLAKNPITAAKKRMEDQKSLALNINADAFAGIKIPNQFLNGEFLRTIRQPKDYSLYDNAIEIDCGTVIHTKNYWHRGIFLVGKKSGKYQIKCTLMCEEYREPQTELIDFVVEG